MKKLFYLISILTVAISSCSKSGYFNLQIPPIPPIVIDHQWGDTISAFVNGTSTSFSHFEQANLYGNYHIHIGGADNGTTNLDLDIESPYPITSGTFTENASAGNPIATIKYTWYDPSGWRYAVPFNSTTNPVTIIITSIDSASVKGIFKGDLQFVPYSGTPIIKSIKNGVFTVNF
jgi:hypothetical protein